VLFDGGVRRAFPNVYTKNMNRMPETYTDRSAFTDHMLVMMARQGDAEAFGELIRRYRSKCIDIATILLKNRADAEDSAQTAFSQAFKNLGQFKGDAEFATWLSRIVSNQCLMLMRSMRRAKFVYLDEPVEGRRTVQMEVPSGDPDPEGETAHRQMLALLQREIRRIPPVMRNVMVLRDIQELPLMDVANQLGITVPAAKSRLLRARLELRSRLTRHYKQIGNSAPLSRSAAPLKRVAHHCAMQPC